MDFILFSCRQAPSIFSPKPLGSPPIPDVHVTKDLLLLNCVDALQNARPLLVLRFLAEKIHSQHELLTVEAVSFRILTLFSLVL